MPLMRPPPFTCFNAVFDSVMAKVPKHYYKAKEKMLQAKVRRPRIP